MGGLCQHLEIEALRQKLAQWEGAAWRKAFADPAAQSRVAVVSSGYAALDRLLPENGFRRGTLVEWLSHAPGDGTATLAFRAAACARSAGDGRAVVVLDRSGEFYPPAAVAQGIEPARLIVVHPGNQADHAWALDQALRCPAVAAAVAWSGCRRLTLPLDAHLSPPAIGRGARRRVGTADPPGRSSRRAFLGRRAAAGRTAGEQYRRHAHRACTARRVRRTNREVAIDRRAASAHCAFAAAVERSRNAAAGTSCANWRSMMADSLCIKH